MYLKITANDWKLIDDGNSTVRMRSYSSIRRTVRSDLPVTSWQTCLIENKLFFSGENTGN